MLTDFHKVERRDWLDQLLVTLADAAPFLATGEDERYQAEVTRLAPAEKFDSRSPQPGRACMTAFTIRLARPQDADAITALIARSVHGLQAGDYSQAQRDAAIGQVFLVDHGLIADGSYFVVEAQTEDGESRLAGAGGWSNRRALHGGHTHGAEAVERITTAEPARIRAYFVDPDFARQGVGTMILRACEDAARKAGFTEAMMGATLTGVAFYARSRLRRDRPRRRPLA